MCPKIRKQGPRTLILRRRLRVVQRAIMQMAALRPPRTTRLQKDREQLTPRLRRDPPLHPLHLLSRRRHKIYFQKLWTCLTS